MTRPGTLINQTTSPPSRSAPTDTGVWFVAAPAQRGPTVATRIGSMATFATVFGDRMTSSLLYDSLELALKEGLSSAYVARVIGPGQATATYDLLDADSRVSLRVYASSSGDWANSMTVAVSAGTTTGYKLTFTYGTTVETADNLTTQADAVAWAQSSALVGRIDIGVGVRVPSTVSARSLTGGREDSGNATDTEYRAALAQFGRDLGPGQVSIPGRTTTATHTMIKTHCIAVGRIRTGLLDLADSSSATTLKSNVVSARTTNASDNVAAFFAPWVTIPGLVPGTTRTVPASALVAGRIASVDAFGSANRAAAGIQDGLSKYALGVTQTFSDADFEDLSSNGVNVIRQTYAGINVFGWRSMIDANGDTSWIAFNNVRLYSQLAALCDNVALNHVFRVIDGAQIEIGKFYSDLVGVLLPFYETGDLYGATSEEAFFVDVGSSVNTLESIAAGELHANIGVRMSPFAEYVVININKVPVEGSVA